jgi:hypothetical protein
MIALDKYSPVMWTDEDGLITAWVSRSVQVVKGMARRGVWTVRKSMVCVTLASATTGAVVAAPVTDVITVDIAPRNVPVRDLHPDQHLVPDGYWKKLGDAFDKLPVAGARDLSEDPEILV